MANQPQNPPNQPPQDEAPDHYKTALEDRLLDAWEWLKAKWHLVAIGLGILIAVVVWWVWSTAAADAAQRKAWVMLEQANSAEIGRADALQGVISGSDDRTVQAFAHALLAKQLLDEYQATLNRDAVSRDAAETHYQTILSSFADQLVPASNARFGLGLISEDKRDFDAARAYYLEIINDSRLVGYPVLEMARARIEMLSELAAPVQFVEMEAPATQPAAPATRPARPLRPLTTQPTAPSILNP